MVPKSSLKEAILEVLTDHDLEDDEQLLDDLLGRIEGLCEVVDDEELEESPDFSDEN